MKRFWRGAAAEQADGMWRILLDGKPMRLPDGANLVLAREALAVAIAYEWGLAGGDVGGEMSWNDVPLTRLAGAATVLAREPGSITTTLLRYADADCLCYRAEHPPALAAAQEASWQPWLDWAERTYGASLLPVTGIVAVHQPPAALAVLEEVVAQLDEWQLAGLAVLVPAYGSLVLGLAVTAGAIGAHEAHGVSIVDELFQEEKWGTEGETAARRALIEAEVAQAERFMRIASTPDSR
jgi:chaperone required for assembly of F1-ATPase